MITECGGVLLSDAQRGGVEMLFVECSKNCRYDKMIMLCADVSHILIMLAPPGEGCSVLPPGGEMF